MPLIAILTAALCALASTASAQTVARYAGRTIDVSRYIPDDAILEYRVSPLTRGLFYRVRVDGVVRMRMVPPEVLDSGVPIRDVHGVDIFPAADLARQHIGIPQYDSLTGSWIVGADTANDEHYDLFEVRLGATTFRRLTAMGRVGRWYALGGRVVFSHWIGDEEPHPTCLTLLTVASAAQKRVLCSDSTTTFNTQVTWRPDGRAFAQPVRIKDRTALAIFTIAGDSATARMIPLGQVGPAVMVVGWSGHGRVHLIAQKEGARNLFDVDVTTGAITQLTRFTNAQLVGVRHANGRTVAITRAIESGRTRFSAFSIPETVQLGSVLLPENTNPIGTTGAHWLLEQASAAAPSSFHILTLGMHGDSAVFTTRALPRPTAPPQPCVIDTVSYTTHDGRTVKGLLRTPRVPLANRDDRLAIIYAYYGGDDSYEELTSVWCEAGIASLSPDIDRPTNADRGGNEVADVLFGARWLRDRLGLKERQIGVFGMSQGGYNAMRALTFQPETNKINVSFDLGFGIAEAGYSSMVTIFHNTNTESPEIIATGDPRTEAGRKRLAERSPLDQIHRLNAPLLLLHGTNDFRVQIVESRQMFEAARAAGKDVTLIELPGEGHGITGAANLARYYVAQLEFLERVRYRSAEIDNRQRE